jgi:uncharacterized protein YdaT
MPIINAFPEGGGGEDNYNELILFDRIPAELVGQTASGTAPGRITIANYDKSTGKLNTWAIQYYNNKSGYQEASIKAYFYVLNATQVAIKWSTNSSYSNITTLTTKNLVKGHLYSVESKQTPKSGSTTTYSYSIKIIDETESTTLYEIASNYQNSAGTTYKYWQLVFS